MLEIRSNSLAIIISITLKHRAMNQLKMKGQEKVTKDKK